MDIVADGHLVNGNFYLNPKEERGLSGLAPAEFMQAFGKKLQGASYPQFEYVSGPCYDVIWALALGLNNTVTAMHRRGIF